MGESVLKKKWYKRWWVLIIGIILALFVYQRISMFIEDFGKKEIPNVMGVKHTDAVSILENNGFKVSEVETEAESILKNDVVYDRSVKQGEVFKINNTIDPSPYGFTTKDKKITIYYEKNDYVSLKEEKKKESQSEEKAIVNTSAPDESSDKPDTSDSVSADFKKAMDSYEAFFDEYAAFMKKYKNSNGADAGLMKDYVSYMSKYADMMKKFNDVDDDEMTAAEAAYYIQVQARITQKLVEAAE